MKQYQFCVIDVPRTEPGALDALDVATFQHILEGYKVADELAAHGAGASTFSDWWAYKLEAYDVTGPAAA